MKRLILYLSILFSLGCSKREELHFGFIQESITINHNESTYLLPWVNFGKDVKPQDVLLVSSNPDVVSVDNEMNGYIKGERIGNATITAWIDNLSYSCNVVVVPTMPTDLIFDKTEQNVYLGDKFNIGGIVEPYTSTYKDLKFEIENPEIISYSGNNVFVANKIGETKVKATIEGTEISKEVIIRVTPILAKRVICDESIKILLGDSGKIYATVRPENAINKKIIWSITDPKVATINEDGVIEGLSLGSTVAIAQVEGSPNISAECKVKICEMDEIATVSTKVGTNGDSYHGFYSYIICRFNTNSTQSVFIISVTLQDETHKVVYERCPVGTFTQYRYEYKTSDSFYTYPAEGWVFTIRYTWNNKDYSSVVVNKGLEGGRGVK